jgi:hypothetical protein
MIAITIYIKNTAKLDVESEYCQLMTNWQNETQRESSSMSTFPMYMCRYNLINRLIII